MVWKNRCSKYCERRGLERRLKIWLMGKNSGCYLLQPKEHILNFYETSKASYYCWFLLSKIYIIIFSDTLLEIFLVYLMTRKLIIIQFRVLKFFLYYKIALIINENPRINCYDEAFNQSHLKWLPKSELLKSSGTISKVTVFIQLF